MLKRLASSLDLTEAQSDAKKVASSLPAQNDVSEFPELTCSTTSLTSSGMLPPEYQTQAQQEESSYSSCDDEQKEGEEEEDKQKAEKIYARSKVCKDRPLRPEEIPLLNLGPDEVAYGYCFDVKRAWRATFEKRTQTIHKNYTKDIVLPASKDDEDLMVAKWKNGEEWKIDCLTYGHWMLQRSRLAKHPYYKFWQDEHEVTGRQVWVCRPRKHNFELIMKEESKTAKWGKTICSVEIHLFKDEGEANHFLTNLAKEYVQGKIETQELYGVRDYYLQRFMELKEAEKSDDDSLID